MYGSKSTKAASAPKWKFLLGYSIALIIVTAIVVAGACGGGDEGIAQAGTMDEMDIGSSSERTAVRQACLTEVGQGEDGASLANACPIQMVLCDSHMGYALGREGDAIIAGKSIGEIKLIESHKD